MEDNKQSIVVNAASGNSIIFAIFFLAKVTGYIDWSWWLVTAPLWAPWVIIFGIFFIWLVIYIMVN